MPNSVALPSSENHDEALNAYAEELRNQHFKEDWRRYVAHQRKPSLVTNRDMLTPMALLTLDLARSRAIAPGVADPKLVRKAVNTARGIGQGIAVLHPAVHHFDEADNELWLVPTVPYTQPETLRAVQTAILRAAQGRLVTATGGDRAIARRCALLAARSTLEVEHVVTHVAAKRHLGLALSLLRRAFTSLGDHAQCAPKRA